MNLNNRSGKGQPAAGARRMDASKTADKTVRSTRQGKAGERPGWASGLRQLYDSVVEEPLPESFNDLIAKLDSKS
jgi:hypothetical protein